MTVTPIMPGTLPPIGIELEEHEVCELERLAFNAGESDLHKRLRAAHVAAYAAYVSNSPTRPELLHEARAAIRRSEAAGGNEQETREIRMALELLVDLIEGGHHGA